MSRLGGNIHVEGNLSASTMSVPANTIDDAAVKSDANVSASKLEHQHQKTYAQGSAATAADARQTLHVVRGDSGLVLHFEAGCIVPCVGAATIAVDLLKNGASILSAPIALSNAQAARATVEAVIPSGTVADGDVLEVDVDATAGGGTLGQGLFAQATIRELAD